MNNKVIGDKIRSIRKDNNMTQKEFADKYNVTYQAVSKWENGKNIPDVELLKKISEDFNIDLSDIVGAKKIDKDNKYNKKNILYIILIIILFISIVIINIRQDDFNHKQITSNCKDFNITGSVAYNKNKSSIQILDVEYCGSSDKTLYSNIDCSLYEKNGKLDMLVGKCDSKNNKNITLDSYLESVSVKVDNYKTICKNYKDGELYLVINATRDDNKVILYNVPLRVNDDCKKVK